MAEPKYRRACSHDGCEGKHKAQGYCLRHYRQWQRGSVKSDASHCAHCGSAFTPAKAGAMYCAKACKMAAWAKANFDRLKILNAEYEERRRLRMAPLIAARKASRAAALVTAKQQKVEARKAKLQSLHGAVRCAVCGLPCGYAGNGPPRTFCSDSCSRASPAAVAGRRAAKAKRRASKRGAAGGQSINPLKVFADAGWRCQICNRPTPEKLRGSTHDRAPELDHVVPLSKGGTHTWSNVQCACRACNRWKSDRLVVGQMGLFSSLVPANEPATAACSA